MYDIIWQARVDKKSQEETELDKTHQPLSENRRAALIDNYSNWTPKEDGKWGHLRSFQKKMEGTTWDEAKKTRRRSSAKMKMETIWDKIKKKKTRWRSSAKWRWKRSGLRRKRPVEDRPRNESENDLGRSKKNLLKIVREMKMETIWDEVKKTRSRSSAKWRWKRSGTRWKRPGEGRWGRRWKQWDWLKWRGNRRPKIVLICPSPCPNVCPEPRRVSQLPVQSSTRKVELLTAMAKWVCCNNSRANQKTKQKNILVY